AISATVPVGEKDAAKRLLRTIAAALPLKPSAARAELSRRLKRSAPQVSDELAKHYGHDLKSVVYIPAVALIGRLRLGELRDRKNELEDVERIVSPYLRGDRPSLPKKAGGSHLSGHLIFTELARRTKNESYLEIAKRVANLGIDPDGKPKPSMPYHSQMSDAVFMGGPILAAVGRLSGEMKYFDACARHVEFMSTLNVRKDGLHRHSPLDPSAWGRGNGFPALGLALVLSDFPKDHPAYPGIRKRFQSHIEALVKYHDREGTWHQVIDEPASYREFSSTCMITFAIVRGIRLKILAESRYQDNVNRAWAAIRQRIRSDGRLVDVCTGTGKQKNLRAYLDRKAILDRDPRGGAMALLVATEIALWEK
ncbi:MAG: glycoside hydrolase family 88 protein, partial [Planctomycetota bacterium]